MAFGTLYGVKNNVRTTGVLAVAKEIGLDLNFVSVDLANPTAEHLKANKLGKIPTFVGEDGFALSECIAILVYFTAQSNNTSLSGKTKQDYASILKWLSFANSEIIPSLAGWYRPLRGAIPYDKKSVDDSAKATLKAVEIMEDQLTDHPFLVGETLSLADLFTAGVLSRGFQFLFDKKFRAENPHITRWFETVTSQPSYSAVTDKVELLNTPAPANVDPKRA
ncbi:hypothetical protein AK830_g11160 [Neonectria ditissima]|uniref:Elongation factor 1-gamma n=1 Tax=Neonectria ditissima TaxID=78410 RepID=A0A0P7B8S7_9HYPO|nr:hypothetical protein AK830_g11160 [Neonectria ditissima]